MTIVADWNVVVGHSGPSAGLSTDPTLSIIDENLGGGLLGKEAI
jgi:hypothetical protein